MHTRTHIRTHKRTQCTHKRTQRTQCTHKRTQCTHKRTRMHTHSHAAGQAGWGIAWYINGTLIPELIVERNKTYTFIIEGGTDPNSLAVYHPFYITDSIVGGRLQNMQQEQEVCTCVHVYNDYASHTTLQYKQSVCTQ